MKKRITTVVLLSCFTILSYAQSIVMTSGSIDFIKAQKTIDFSFSYEEMLVGKLTEKEYVDKKVSEYNKKEEGKGDQWKEAWHSDRKERFEPKFLELFDKYMSEVGITAGTEGAQYRIEINTDFTEPGWNVGVMRQNASIDLSCKVKHIETGEQVSEYAMPQPITFGVLILLPDIAFRKRMPKQEENLPSSSSRKQSCVK